MKISRSYGIILVLTGIVAGLLLANCSDRDSDRKARAAGLEKAPWNVRLRVDQAVIPPMSTSPVNVLTHSGKGGYVKAIIWGGELLQPVADLTIQVDGQPPLTFDSTSHRFGTSESSTPNWPFLRRLPIGEGIRFQNSLSIEGTNPPNGSPAPITVVWGVDI